MRYYKEDEVTRKAKQGFWYHTGDIAWADERSYIYYVGRNDDLKKSSGYRLVPHEIESVLFLHDAAVECAITGVPDKDSGMIVKACIVLNSGFKSSYELIDLLHNFLKRKIAPYKYLQVLECVDELPR
ncbi:MAG: AMP-binding protein [Eggerthellaceae bacterium]|nr:AMP-binding protein [Eggerthellaceae bacterium]